jgi:hypothetical protein
MYAPSKQGEQPSVEVSKEFMMSPNKLHLEASLDKELYYHGETVAVNVHIQNNSNKSVKKVKVSGKSSIFFFSVSSYSKVVDDFPSISVIFLQNSSYYFHFYLNDDILTKYSSKHFYCITLGEKCSVDVAFLNSVTSTTCRAHLTS